MSNFMCIGGRGMLRVLLIISVLAGYSAAIWADDRLSPDASARAAVTTATPTNQELLPFANENQRQLYLQLTAELRCPQCQNQNIADSNAVVAVDMREKTYELVQQGYNRAEVLDYMIARYGDFVHYLPPVNHVTVWLWLAPGLLLVSLLLLQLRRRSAPVITSIAQGALANHAEAESASTAQQQLNQQLESIIEQYRSKKP